MTVGERIREARKKAGLTQKELGKKLGVAYQTLAQWENDLRNPKIETLMRIADALEVPFVEITDRLELTGQKGIYIDPNDYIDAIKPYLSDLELLSGREDALRTLLNEMGYDILKARGKYFFSYGDNGFEISKDDLNELFNCAKDGLKVVAKTLELKALQKSSGFQKPQETDMAAQLAELKRQNQEMAAEIAAMKEEDAAAEQTERFLESVTSSR